MDWSVQLGEWVPLSRIRSGLDFTVMSAIGNPSAKRSIYLFNILLGMRLRPSAIPMGESVPVLDMSSFHIHKSERIGRLGRRIGIIMLTEETVVTAFLMG